MADVFEARVELEPWRERLWELIAQAHWLDWLLLTKRPENVSAMAPWGQDWPPNVWLGTTVENQEYANRRTPVLSEIPARVRFLSCKPLLGPLDLRKWLDAIHWIIVGGESGRAARPAEKNWVEAVRDQAVAARVAFHFKQWGEWAPILQGMKRVGKKAAGRALSGRTWDQLPSILGMPDEGLDWSMTQIGFDVP